MNLFQLQTIDCDALTALSDQYRAASTMAHQAADDLELKTSTRMHQTLSGLAADAAQGQLTALAQNFRYIEVETGAAGTTLATYAAEMRQYQNYLAELGAWCVHQGLQYGFDCAVTYNNQKGEPQWVEPQSSNRPPQFLDHSDADVDDPLYPPAQELSNQLCTLWAKVNEIDRQFSRDFENFQADDDLTVSTADWQDSRADTDTLRDDLQGLNAIPPPAGRTPSENAAWWKSLGPRDQARYMSTYPSDLAAMEGLPDDVRAQASRIDYEQHA